MNIVLLLPTRVCTQPLFIAFPDHSEYSIHLVAQLKSYSRVFGFFLVPGPLVFLNHPINIPRSLISLLVTTPFREAAS